MPKINIPITIIRQFRPGDAPALLSLFRDTVRRVNSRDYGPEQVRAWASDEIAAAEWSARFLGRFVPVAEVDGQVAGFAELESDGHIDRFYVSADHQGTGIGRALLQAIVAEARRLKIQRLYVESSVTARRFFERRMFQIVEQRTVVLRGVEFQQFFMTRLLD